MGHDTRPQDGNCHNCHNNWKQQLVIAAGEACLQRLELCLVQVSGVPEAAYVIKELLPDLLQSGVNHLPENCLHSKTG